MGKIKKCESVEDFLSRGGQIEYCTPADERMMAIQALNYKISGHYIDADYDFPDLPKQRICDHGSEIDLSDSCFWRTQLPAAE